MGVVTGTARDGKVGRSCPLSSHFPTFRSVFDELRIETAFLYSPSDAHARVPISVVHRQ